MHGHVRTLEGVNLDSRQHIVVATSGIILDAVVPFGQSGHIEVKINHSPCHLGADRCPLATVDTIVECDGRDVGHLVEDVLLHATIVAHLADDGELVHAGGERGGVDR